MGVRDRFSVQSQLFCQPGYCQAQWPKYLFVFPLTRQKWRLSPVIRGGPLFNLESDVIGINSQIYTRSGGSIGLSFAIPYNSAKMWYRN